MNQNRTGRISVMNAQLKYKTFNPITDQIDSCCLVKNIYILEKYQ